MNNKRDILNLHLTTALLGLSGVIGKFVSWPAAAVTFGRVLSSSTFLLIVMLIKKERIRLNCRKDYAFIFCAGVIMAIHWTTFMQSIKVSSVAIGTITFSTFPLFITFLEPLIYKEKLKFSNVLIAIVMLVGVYITVPEFSMGNATTIGIIWGMVGSLTYAILSLMNRYFSAEYSGKQVCLYEQGVATVVLLPFALQLSFEINMVEIGAILFMGIICTAVAHSLFISALKRVKVQTAGIISGMETVYGIVFAMILLHDMITARELIGGLIILSAAAYKTVKS